MTPEETPVEVECPYCGESIELLIDASQKSQDYVEDCSVCCKPMKVHAEIDEEGGATASVAQENEA